MKWRNGYGGLEFFLIRVGVEEEDMAVNCYPVIRLL
jgi:hypothetical protein